MIPRNLSINPLIPQVSPESIRNCNSSLFQCPSPSNSQADEKAIVLSSTRIHQNRSTGNDFHSFADMSPNANGPEYVEPLDASTALLLIQIDLKAAPEVSGVVFVGKCAHVSTIKSIQSCNYCIGQYDQGMPRSRAKSRQFNLITPLATCWGFLTRSVHLVIGYPWLCLKFDGYSCPNLINISSSDNERDFGLGRQKQPQYVECKIERYVEIMGMAFILHPLDFGGGGGVSVVIDTWTDRSLNTNKLKIGFGVAIRGA